MASLKPETVVDFFRLVMDAESGNRAQALEDLRFRFGDQWSVTMQNARKVDERPQFVINETDGYCRQVVNHLRQMRPRGRARPVGNGGDLEVAKVLTGIGRHIEVHSDADNAYDTAMEFAVTMGWGYWRVLTDYVADVSFDQDIRVAVLDNPFSVYFDPSSVLPDGSDAKRCLISTMIKKTDFKAQWPNAETSGFEQRGSGDTDPDWETQEDIRIAEYFWIESERQKLVLLSDKSTVWEDALPPEAVLAKEGLAIISERESFRKTVKWAKCTNREVLEEKTLPGRFIPVIPVYGVNVPLDGKRLRMGLVRMARDPQRLVNYWQTSVTETIALAPKAKWMMEEGQDEGHEREWQRANVSTSPVLHYKGVDDSGREMPPPQRIQPEPPPAGAVESAMMASQNLQRVLGMFDPVNLEHTGPKSGEAIHAETGQSEQSNYHYYDNETRSIRHTWRIFLDYAPVIYDTERTLDIMGEDDKPDQVTVNQMKTEDGIEKMHNPITVGMYDVIMDVGPGYNTKRQEAVATLMNLMRTPLGEKIAQVADFAVVRQMDFSGASMIADLLEAANPLAKLDEDSDVPPKAQLMIKSLQNQLQQAMQQIQMLSDKDRAEMQRLSVREQGETTREHLRQTAKAHDIDSRERATLHDVQTRALSAQNVEEIKGLVHLLMHRLNAGPEIAAAQAGEAQTV